jgi:hypothetical protein
VTEEHAPLVQRAVGRLVKDDAGIFGGNYSSLGEVLKCGEVSPCKDGQPGVPAELDILGHDTKSDAVQER